MWRCLLLYICCFIIFSSCSTNSKPTETRTKDSLAFLQNIQWYDSLSDAETTDSKIFTCQKLLPFSDTVVSKGELFLSDSVFRRKFFKYCSYRIDDLSILQQFGSSLDLYNRFAYLYDSLHQPYDTWYFFAKKIVADIYTRYGDNKKAISYLKDVLLNAESTQKTNRDSNATVSTAINLSTAWAETGENDSAIYILQRFGQYHTISERRKALLHATLGLYLIKKADTVSANIAANTAISIAKQSINNKGISDALQVSYSLLGDMMAGKKKYDSALHNYRLAMYWLLNDNAEYRRRETGKLLNSLGKVFEENKQSDSALRFYHQALYSVADVDTGDIFSLPDEKNIYAENTIMESLDNMAACIIKKAAVFNQNQLAHAIKCWQLAAHTERILLQKFSYDESKVAMLQSSRMRSEQAINACYLLYQLTKDNKWVSAAFDFAEKNKAFILLESARRNTAARLLQNDSLFRNIQNLQLEYATLEKTKITAALTNDSDLLKQVTVQLSEKEKKVVTENDKLRQSNTAYNTWMQQENNIDLNNVTEFAKKTNTGFIEYFTGDSSVFSFSTSPTGQLYFQKLVYDISEATNNFLTYFTDKNAVIKNIPGYIQQAHYLFLNLQISKAGNAKKLIIIPDGNLNFLPFDALVASAQNKTSLNNIDYLLKQTNISYNWSAALLMQQYDDQYKENESTIAFAPVFKNNYRGFAELQFSKEETDDILKYNPSTKKYTGQQATLQQFKMLAPHAGIIHIASHGSFKNILPHIEFYDSTLYLDELYAMQLNARLVVLSACETGLGKIEKTEGAMSLARGFYYAGAKNVVTSLWQVDDKATTVIMENFYRQLPAQNISGALHQSKLSYLNTTLPADKYSPYYWAGFIAAGFDEKQTRHWFWECTGIIAALILLSIIWFKKTKAGT